MLKSAFSRSVSPRADIAPRRMQLEPIDLRGNEDGETDPTVRDHLAIKTRPRSITMEHVSALLDAGSNPLGPQLEAIVTVLKAGNAFEPESQETIPASFIRELLTRTDLKFGVALKNVRIEGDLVLSDIRPGTETTSLILEGCVFTGAINLSYCRFNRVSLAHSRFRHLKARHLRVDTCLDISSVYAPDAQEASTTSGLHAPHLWWDRQTAIKLERLHPGADPQSDQSLPLASEWPLQPECSIDLRGAFIGADLYAGRSRLVGTPDDYALNLAAATIGNDLKLCEDDENDGGGASLFGGLSLNGLRLGGNLWANHLIVWASKTLALSLQSMRIGNSLVMTDCLVRGRLDGLLMQVNGSAYFNNMTFAPAPQSSSPDKQAQPSACFDVWSAIIEGALHLSGVSVARGIEFGDVVLGDSTVGGLIAHELNVDALYVHSSIRNDLELQQIGARKASLIGSTIGGSLKLIQEETRSKAHSGLNWVFASQMHILGSTIIDLTHSDILDILDFENSSIGGDCAISAKIGLALNFEDAKIDGSLKLLKVDLYNRSTGPGKLNSIVNLKNATIKGALQVKNIEYKVTQQPTPTIIHFRSKTLSFYDNYTLTEALFLDGDSHKVVALLAPIKSKKADPVLLNGSSIPIHELNPGALRIRDEQSAKDYLRFFCAHIWTDLGAFHIREQADAHDPDSIRDLIKASASTQSSADLDTETLTLTDEVSGADAKFAIKAIGKNTYRAQALIQYGNGYFIAKFLLDADGTVEMTDDHPILQAGVPVSPLYLPVAYAPPFRFSRLKDQDPDFASGPFLNEIETWRTASRSEKASAEQVLREIFSPSLRAGEKAPFCIDLSGARVDALDDRFGQAWDEDILDREPGDWRAGSAKLLRLALDGLTFNRIITPPHDDWGPRYDQKTRQIHRERWLNRQLVHIDTGRVCLDHNHYRPQPYHQLIAVYRSTGYTDAATDIAVKLARLNGRLAGKEAPILFNTARSAIAQLSDGFRWAGLAVLISSIALVSLALWSQASDHPVGVALITGVLAAILFAPVLRVLISFWQLLFGLLFRYGLSPGRAFITTASLIILGWLGALQANHTGLLVVDVVPSATEVFVDETGAPVALGLRNASAPLQTVSCGAAIDAGIYAIDLFIPVVELRQEQRCYIRPRDAADLNRYPADTLWGLASRPAQTLSAIGKDPGVWLWARSIFILLGWIVISLTLLTVTGLLRRQGLDDR